VETAEAVAAELVDIDPHLVRPLVQETLAVEELLREQ
tara:strand:- start:403 stop:513 length:111 start_codon:yes stop_codon:yes gene_type:complete